MTWRRSYLRYMWSVTWHGGSSYLGYMWPVTWHGGSSYLRYMWSVTWHGVEALVVGELEVIVAACSAPDDRKLMKHASYRPQSLYHCWQIGDVLRGSELKLFESESSNDTSGLSVPSFTTFFNFLMTICSVKLICHTFYCGHYVLVGWLTTRNSWIKKLDLIR